MFILRKRATRSTKSRTRGQTNAQLRLDALEDRNLMSGLMLMKEAFHGGSGNEVGTGVSVVDAGTRYEAFASGYAEGSNYEGVLANYHAPYTLRRFTPGWSTLWPGVSGYDAFWGVAATATAVYAGGDSFSQTTDNVGDKESKGVTVSFPIGGGNQNWKQQTPGAPGAFSYGGGESMYAITSATENNQTFLYATGAAQSGFFSQGRLWLSKLNASGTILWTRTDSAGDPRTQGSKAVADGTHVYIAGYTDASGTRQGHLRKYDTNGNLQWTKTSVAGQFNGAALDGGGFLYTVGHTNAPSVDFLIEKWDLSGNKIWSVTYDRNGAEDILNGAALLNGQLFAAGSTRGNTAGGSDGVILEINPANGTLADTTLWGGGSDDSFADVVAANGLLVTGTTKSYGAGGSDIAFLAYKKFSSPAPIPPPPVRPSGNVATHQAVSGATDFTSNGQTPVSDAAATPTEASGQPIGYGTPHTRLVTTDWLASTVPDALALAL